MHRGGRRDRREKTRIVFTIFPRPRRPLNIPFHPPGVTFHDPLQISPQSLFGLGSMRFPVLGMWL